MSETKIQIVLFDGFDELDAIGPYEVFDTAARLDAALTVELVTLAETDAVRANHGLCIEPEGTLTDPDVVIVPGGGWNDGRGGAREQVARGELPEAVAGLHATGTTVASVCTGGMILAHAGVLDGRPATTHAGALDELRESFESVESRSERVVDDGSVLTCGGVTSGLDLSLQLVERIADGATADRVAMRIEYDRWTA
ncbi:DJ-1/PfpI family protein [Halocatena pleomorpha]|uniref:DJ-1/PfpI family protein n=1 Tax=Halocatena pleomorpha TaxID=1785090 RepID=A0A3P3RHR9_9EURY|nr:DJ-1/PfpI family protein [Halocatena pleomorpha]RRJ33086.1 DJ-1/PfpI family protein [Halocatena pleomorpha]